MADILDKVTSIFSGDGADPEKRILSKVISRDISQNRYAKLYRIRTEELEPAFACYFYDIYKTVYPARLFLRRAKNKVELQRFAAEIFMDEAAIAAERRLSEALVEEREGAVPPADQIRRLKADLACFSGAFDGVKKAAADQCYNLIEIFSGFVNFDFPLLLRKFDPKLEEGNPAYKPRFESVRAEHLTGELQTFLACSASVIPGEDWDTVLNVFKAANGGTELIPPDRWNKLINKLQDIRAANILTLIIEYTIKDPLWELKPKKDESAAAVTWIEAKKAEAEKLIGAMSGALRQSQIADLAKTIFTAADSVRLRYYNRERDTRYLKKDLNGLVYAPGLNYLTAFIQDYVNKEIKDLCDLLLIRGQWTSNALSMDMSGNYHDLAALEEDIAVFDGSLAEDGALGIRLKTSMLRVDRNPYQAAYINTILNGINAEALDILRSAGDLLDSLTKHFKDLAGDCIRIPHELLFNWKELELFSKDPLPQRIEGAYKKTRLFSQMIRLYTNPPE
jgi:hypothetical protein